MVAARASRSGPRPSPHSLASALRRRGADGTAQNLSEKVRALYEHSAVPVAEIARARRRHRAHDLQIRRQGALDAALPLGAVRVAARRRWRAGRAIGAGVRAPAGASSAAPTKASRSRPASRRPIRPPPHAPPRPAGASSAVAGGAARAEAEQRDEARLRALETLNQALAELNRHRAARAKAGQPGLRDDDRVAQALVRAVEIATERWQRLLAH